MVKNSLLKIYRLNSVFGTFCYRTESYVVQKILNLFGKSKAKLPAIWNKQYKYFK